MDFSSLIGAGTSLIGGLLGGGKSTTTQEGTSTPTVSPELDAEIKRIFERIPGIFGRPFPEFQGDRVAQPTESRDQMNPFIAAINNGGMMDRARGINPYQDRINQMMNMSPNQVSVPTMLGDYGGNGVQLSGGYNDVDVQSMLPTTAPYRPQWQAGANAGGQQYQQAQQPMPRSQGQGQPQERVHYQAGEMGPQGQGQAWQLM